MGKCKEIVDKSEMAWKTREKKDDKETTKKIKDERVSLRSQQTEGISEMEKIE